MVMLLRLVYNLPVLHIRVELLPIWFVSRTLASKIQSFNQAYADDNIGCRLFAANLVSSLVSGFFATHPHLIAKRYENIEESAMQCFTTS